MTSYESHSNEQLLDELLKKIILHGEVWPEYRELRAEVLRRMFGGEGWSFFEDQLPDASNK